MEQETAGNKIIAEFMGAEFVEPIGHEKRYIKFPVITGGLYIQNDAGLKYHTSWDWLYQAIEKIEGLGYRFKQCRKRVVLEHDRQPSVEGKIQSAWKAVVRFIEEFNSQQINKKEV